jgi:acetyltransferase-like isoleucine patch superfamily enzyme
LKIGKNVTIYPGVYLWGNDIEIGDNVDIGIGTIIHSTNGVKIGSNTAIAGQCYIIDSNHGTKQGVLIRDQENDVAENGISIGSDVWIAAQCSILKGANIHDHAIIGAQSLVNRDIPANAIAVGTPAKVIKYRT